MKIPATPPAFDGLVKQAGSERLLKLLAGSDAADKRYLHWNDLRRKTAPGDHSSEEWWLAIKWKRRSEFRSIPLRDKQGAAFVFCIPDRLQQSLHEIDRGLGFALDLPPEVASPEARDSYVLNALFQESITSSQLEGAATTREVAREMLRTGRPPRDKSERMILNNYHTMQRIQHLRGQEMTVERMLELHRCVTEGTLERADASGRFRRPEENVRVEDLEGQVFHEPPPAAELPERCAAMCRFANGGTPAFFVHPVIRAIILHFWLAYDHPFVDGNGRTARALFYWLMLRQRYSLFEFISISQILLKAPARYAEAFLLTETDDNDLTYFILHQAEVIQKAVAALHEYAAHKTAELKAAEKLLRGTSGLNHRQQALLAHALRNSGSRYLIDGHRRSHGVSFPTARHDLFDLVKRGLLGVAKEGRFNVFRPASGLKDRLNRPTEAPAPEPGDETLPLKY